MKNSVLPWEQLFEMVFGRWYPDSPLGRQQVPRQLPSDLLGNPERLGKFHFGLISLLHSETHLGPVTLLFPGPNC